MECTVTWQLEWISHPFSMLFQERSLRVTALFAGAFRPHEWIHKPQWARVDYFQRIRRKKIKFYSRNTLRVWKIIVSNVQQNRSKDDEGEEEEGDAEGVW